MVIGVLLVVAAIVALRIASSGPKPIAADRLSDVHVQPIDGTVSASGTLTPNRQAHLNFQTSGYLADVLVGAGDTVRAGQPLARLQSDDLADKLVLAQSQLAQAQTKLKQLSDGAAPQDLAAAQAAYDAAVARYDDLVGGPSPSDRAAAQAAVSQAQSLYAEAAAKLRALQAPTDADHAGSQFKRR